MCYFGIFVFHTGHMTLLVAFVTIIFGLGTGGVYYIPWTAYTFMADVDEIVTNRRREGVYAGAMTMAGKLMRASIVCYWNYFFSNFIMRRERFYEKGIIGSSYGSRNDSSTDRLWIIRCGKGNRRCKWKLSGEWQF